MRKEPPRSVGSGPTNAPLNPALKSEVDPSYGSAFQGTAPLDTVSVKKAEGTAWPMIWAITAIVCVVLTLVLLFL